MTKNNTKRQTISVDDLYQHDTQVTPIQSGAFNSIVTDISKHIYFLWQSKDVPNFLTHLAEQQAVKDTTQDIEEWQTQDIEEWQTQKQHKQWLAHLDNNFEMVLNHLYKIILPEVYVFFHDDSTTTRERRNIHKMTADILQKFETWRYKTSTEYTPLQKQIMGNHINLSMADDYLIGKGDNADIACKILPLAKLSDIDGFHYLRDLQPLLHTLSEDKWLLDFLSLESSDIVKQLDYWQQQRLSHFSVPDIGTLYNQPALLKIRLNHPIARHIQQNMNNNNHYLQKLNSQQSDSSESNSVSHYFDSRTNHRANHRAKILAHHQSTHQTHSQIANSTERAMYVDSQQLKKGAILGIIGLLMVFVDPTSVEVNFFLDLLSTPFLFMSGINVARAFISHDEHKLYKNVGGFVLSIGLLIFILGMPKLLALYVFAFAFGSYVKIYGEGNKSDVEYESENDGYEDDYENDAIDDSENNSENYVEEKVDNTILLPINLHRHAYYLAQLLSSEGINVLNQLISEINQAHAHLDYLREYHPYLATSVHELIMDVTINSVLRLDQVAQKSVRDGQVSHSAKAMFAQNHEQNVNELFHNHLEELQDLNTSIMEKQMSGFENVGSETEKQFRDSVMEFRILLKWFIAQAPDTDIGVSADEVLLNKLEESTLKQMQDVFYQDDTTDEQRAELQSQIDELLSHFQAQSPKNTQLEHEQDLLTLTHEPNVLYQSETQAFIDFNKQYVKQLKQHW